MIETMAKDEYATDPQGVAINPEEKKVDAPIHTHSAEKSFDRPFQNSGAPRMEAGRGAERIDQKNPAVREAYKTINHAADEAYAGASQALKETSQTAMKYVQENPSSVILIAFGAGIGLGLLLGGGRSHTNRVLPIAINMASTIVSELLR